MSKILILVGAIILLIVIFLKYQPTSMQQIIEEMPLSYEECVNLPSAQKIDSYPKTCDWDGKLFIEAIKEPIDTSSWETFDTKSGFTFKCPPGWHCSKIEEPTIRDAYILSNPDYRITSQQINLINKNNFSDSIVRHPSYRTPRQWFNALKAKNSEAIKVYPSTRTLHKNGYVYPNYVNYDLSSMKEFNSQVGVGVLISRLVPHDGGKMFYQDVILPLNETDVVLIAYYQDDPILKAVISSINK